MSTDGISSRDAGSLKGSIFSSISEALDFEGAGPHGEHPIVKKSSVSLVSFAQKLSEGQLHCLYSALKEWENAATPNPDASNTARRVAFGHYPHHLWIKSNPFSSHAICWLWKISLLNFLMELLLP